MPTSRPICGEYPAIGSIRSGDGSVVTFRGSLGRAWPTAIRDHEYDNRRHDEQATVHRPLRLPRHEAARNDVDSLQKPHTAYEEGENRNHIED